MLTRGDYIGMCHAMADGIASGKMIDSLCMWLSKDNPRFDRAKFECSWEHWWNRSVRR